MNKDWYNKLRTIFNEDNIKIEEPLKEYTSFKIGGSADFLVTPSNIEELVSTTKLCKDMMIPYYVIGNGSNLLVGDKGYHGVIIHISPSLSDFEVEKLRVTQGIEYYQVIAESGVLLSDLASQIANCELTGFEFASGIPGSLGGALTMNAGAYGGEMKDCVTSAKVIDEHGEIITLNLKELELGYRTSAIQKRGLVVLSVEFQFAKGEKEAIISTMDELAKKRQEKQPLELPSAGSAFKRPEGHFAGKLIMDAGLRGYRVGDIMISTKHCGFVVNVGEGSAKDVKAVLSHVDNTVFEKYGVHLEPEVRFLGDF